MLVGSPYIEKPRKICRFCLSHPRHLVGQDIRQAARRGGADAAAHPEDVAQHLLGNGFARRAVRYHMTVVQDDDAVGEYGCQIEVVQDCDDGNAALGAAACDGK